MSTYSVHVKLLFDSETEGAEFSFEITDTDITKGVGAEFCITATYNISVYAFKEGYYNSDVVYATLCWIDAEPKTEGLTNDISAARGQAVMIQSRDGLISVSGVNDGTNISIYNIAGAKVGSANAIGGQSSIYTNIKTGEIAIVKIGEKSVKIRM